MDRSAELIAFSGQFRSVLRSINQEWNKRMTHNLSYTQFKMMYRLHLEKRLKVSELAESMGLTSGAITGVADKLVAEDYVVRERATDDRRVVYIEITSKGKLMIEELLESQSETILSLFTSLPDEDIQHLKRIFAQLIANIEKL
ncbi:MarR family winged helix-turn-helix transcriptional regulator [Paenibacillus radicis (ex Gao et al. 2016)]|uniref:MarR family transcriptional regulator n=1 Tax=Paenibacillus radicis (ex Gao et al. 2016) TaxID=1737354 RepID=A0A917HGD8_9BACL|nr:MarR family transcriptional regulator [Paenibacillus radicis (ex Gao et al. 2016)]GGG78340.1 MarR family transcriptional regulator [Paenibacillus radicis (ex Gao et al. 2016)]